MQTGRITQQEQIRRLKLLLQFVFNFRYATRTQLVKFAETVIKLSYPRGLIDYSRKQGYFKAYYNSNFKTKLYYLSQKAKELLSPEEIFIKHYHFDKRQAGTNVFDCHNFLTESYFLLQKHIEIKEWACEWVIRIGKKKREKLPDGLMILPDGKKIALELEAQYKKLSVLDNLVARYRNDIEGITKYHFVLIIASNRSYYDSIKAKLFNIAPEFCAKAFILTDLAMLEQGKCFYKGEVRLLKETVVLWKNY